MGGCPDFVALDFMTASLLLCDIVVFCSLVTGQRPDHPFPLSLCGWLCSHRCLMSPLGRTRSALGHGRCCSRLSWPARHLAQVLCIFLSSGWDSHSLLDQAAQSPSIPMSLGFLSEESELFFHPIPVIFPPSEWPWAEGFLHSTLWERAKGT